MPSSTLALIAGPLFALIITTQVPQMLAAGPENPEIGVLLRFDAEPGRAFISTMERELARLMAPADLRLRWLMPEDSDGKQSFARAVIFTFHGACRAISDSTGNLGGAERISLADTAIEGTVILPYSEMNCDRLRGFLSSEEPQAAGAETRLGLAMARVLAHEMYHVLLQTRAHSSHGIARAAHTPSALLSKSLRFDQEEISRIRARFASHEIAQNMSFKPN